MNIIFRIAFFFLEITICYLISTISQTSCIQHIDADDRQEANRDVHKANYIIKYNDLWFLEFTRNSSLEYTIKQLTVHAIWLVIMAWLFRGLLIKHLQNRISSPHLYVRQVNLQTCLCPPKVFQYIWTPLAIIVN